MKKLLMLSLLAAFFSLSAFSETYYEFTDDFSDTIRLEKKPQSVCVIFSSYTEMWILSGGSVEMTVGESIERGFVSDDTPLADAGAGKKVDLEKIAYHMPDLIIGSCDIPSHMEAKEILSELKIPFALFRVESIDDYLRVFKIMTDINGNADAYKEHGENVYLKATEIIERAKALYNDTDILFIRSGSGYSSAKAKTSDMHFAAKMLSDLGAINIADEVPVILDGLSFEEIYEKDPDAIFITLMGNEEAARAYMESLLNEETWQALKAVKNGRYYFLSKELFQFKPNHMWAKAYEEMARMLYPEWEIEMQYDEE